MAPSAPGYFAVPAAIGPADVAAWVGGVAGPVQRASRRWYDTFDWRLWREDLVLEADEVTSGRVDVVLRRRGDHEPMWSQAVATIPRTAAELPPGPWRRTLESVLGMRALVPVATTRLERSCVEVTDADEKVVAQGLWEAGDLPSPATGDQPLRWVRVVPVRGYPRPARELVARLRAHPDLDAVASHPLELAVTDGRTPGRSGVELDLRLDPSTPAVDAMFAILHHLHRSMQVVEPWLHDPPDVEFLHDHRVALRRSRSALKLARGILDVAVLDEWRPALRDLQQRSGLLRDLDVFVLELPSYRQALPTDFAAALDPLLELLERKRRTAQRSFVRYLGSDAHRQLTSRYAELVAGGAGRMAPGDTDDAPDARRPIVDAAADRIRRLHRRLIRRGRQVQPHSDASRLHQTRIAGKELRYGIELHASLLPERERRRLITRLKRLQDVLGGFQDAEVQATAMEAFAAELTASGEAPARTVMALGLLVRDGTDRKETLRDRFAERFAELDSRATEELVATMLDRARAAA